MSRLGADEIPQPQVFNSCGANLERVNVDRRSQFLKLAICDNHTQVRFIQQNDMTYGKHDF